MDLRRVAPTLSIAAGAILALLFWDSRWGWFQGGPLGLGLIALGVLELIERGAQSTTDRPTGPRGLVKRDIADTLGTRDARSGQPDAGGGHPNPREAVRRVRAGLPLAADRDRARGDGDGDTAAS